MKPLTLLAVTLFVGGLVPLAAAQNTPPSPPHLVSTTADAFHLLDEARARNEDRDLQFVRQLIRLNETAINAAKDILKTSYNADIRMMAGDSMKAHDAELRTLKAWVDRHGPQPTAAVSATLVTSDTAPAPLAAENPALNLGAPETFDDAPTNAH